MAQEAAAKLTKEIVTLIAIVVVDWYAMTRTGMTLITVEQVQTLFMHPGELGVIGLHALSLVEVREPKPAPANVSKP